MLKIILTVVCALVAVALGTSIISTVVQHSEIHTQSQRIAALQQEETDTKHQVSVLRTELRPQAKVHPAQHIDISKAQLQLSDVDGRVVGYHLDGGWRLEFVAS